MINPKNLLFALLLAQSGFLFANTPSFNIATKCFLESFDNGLMRMSFSEDSLNSEGKNSLSISNGMTWDGHKTYVLSLNHIAYLHSGDEKSKIFQLTLVRIDDEITRYKQLQKKKVKIKGESSKTIEIVQASNGDISSSYFNEAGQFIREEKGVPQEISIEYSVPRGFMEPRQNLKFRCELDVDILMKDPQ